MKLEIRPLIFFSAALLWNIGNSVKLSSSSELNRSSDPQNVTCSGIDPMGLPALDTSSSSADPIEWKWNDNSDIKWTAARFLCWFLLWTMMEYWSHRFFHWNHRWNFFYKMHQHHHSLSIEQLTDEANRWPKPLYFVWFFDNLYETIEIVAGETVWALLIYYFDPKPGGYLLLFHYVYELLATDSLLEHNPELEARYGLAVGKFHMEHHRVPLVNFGFTIDVWDRLFGTYRPTGGNSYICKTEVTRRERE